MSEEKVKRYIGKALFIGKLLLLWVFAALMIVIWASRASGETFFMLIADWKSDFVDNPVLPQLFRNKLKVLAVLFVLLLIAALVTEDFVWKIKIFRWRIEFGTKSGGVLAFNLCFGAAAVAFVLMGVTFLGSQVHKQIIESWSGDVLVAHACGGIDDTNYTNCQEAFDVICCEL